MFRERVLGADGCIPNRIIALGVSFEFLGITSSGMNGFFESVCVQNHGAKVPEFERVSSYMYSSYNGCCWLAQWIDP